MLLASIRLLKALFISSIARISLPSLKFDLIFSRRIEVLNCGQTVTTQEALELLIELIGTEPRFLRRQLVDVVGSILQIDHLLF